MPKVKENEFQKRSKAKKKLKCVIDKVYANFPQIVFLIVFTHILFCLLIPFFYYNSLFSVDMSGHYFSSWYIKEYTFPSSVGWNPFFFFGFPQNQFYEPLFSYSVALISFIIPIDLAFKLLIAAILILTPVSFYYFSRTFEFSTQDSAAITLLMYACLFFPNSFWGGTFTSTLNTGLVTHALGIMLFFFFISELKKSFDSGKFLLSSVLLTLIILSHLITSLAAITALIAFATVNWKMKGIRIGAKILLLASLLSAFWIIPAVSNASYIYSFSAGLIPNELLLLALAFMTAVYFKLAKQNKLFLLGSFLTLLIGLMCLADKIFSITMHYYRLQIFILLLAPMLFIGFFKRNQKYFAVLAVTIFAVAFIASPHILSEGAMKKTIAPLPEDIDGRVLILSTKEQQTSEHELQQAIPMMNRVNGVRGLFQESSNNSKVAYNMEYELEPLLYLNQNTSKENDVNTSKEDDSNTKVLVSYDSNYQATQDSYETATKTDLQKILPLQFNLLNINYVISTVQIDKTWVPIKPIVDIYFLNDKKKTLEKNKYVLYKVADSNLVEVLHYTPRIAPNASWIETSGQWLLTTDIIKGIFTNGKVPDYNGSGNETVEILEKSRTLDYLKFRVNSNIEVPVLIKISEFPNWKAYSQGKELHIYKASPGFMLVNAKGIVELKYENTWSEYLGYLLFAIGLILLTTGAYLNMKRKVASPRKLRFS